MHVRCFRTHTKSRCQGMFYRVLLLYYLQKYLTIKAILSQFSKTNKASSNADKEAADNDRFDDLQDSRGLGDEEEYGAEPADEMDPSVDESDNIAVDGVGTDVDLDGRVPPLTHEEVNLGRFSVLKVCYLSMAYCLCL
jgi:hypothetical protein